MSRSYTSSPLVLHKCVVGLLHLFTRGGVSFQWASVDTFKTHKVVCSPVSNWECHGSSLVPEVGCRD
jgi:hypothetical protein